MAKEYNKHQVAAPPRMKWRETFHWPPEEQGTDNDWSLLHGRPFTVKYNHNELEDGEAGCDNDLEYFIRMDDDDSEHFVPGDTILESVYEVQNGDFCITLIDLREDDILIAEAGELVRIEFIGNYGTIVVSTIRGKDGEYGQLEAKDLVPVFPPDSFGLSKIQEIWPK